MKKILALVLALTLALGTFSFAAAAPADVEGTDYEDAVVRLGALGIIAGFPDGTYKPDEPVTRAQFAKIIVTALGVGEAANYAAGTTKFADVPADHWAAGYINVAVDVGVINGYPDGTFKPENQVTFAEAIKMIVAALGYTPKAEAMGGYPGGYLAVAAEKEITKGMSVVGGLAANRGDIALMVDNALDVPLMVQKTYGQYPEYEEDDTKSLLVTKLGVDEFKGVVTDVPLSNSKLDDDEIEIDGKEYTTIVDMDLNYFFGLEVKVWADDDDIFFMEVETDEDNILYDTVAKNADATEVSLYVEDDEFEWAKGADIYVNFKSAKATDVKKDMYGRVVLNDDEEVVFASFFNFSTIAAGVVTAVEDGVYEVVLFDGAEDEFDIEDYDDGVFVFGPQFEKLDVEDIDIDSAVFAWADSDELYVIVANEKETGILDRVRVDSVRVDGTVYDKGVWGMAYSDDGKDNFAQFTAVADLDNLGGEEVTVVFDLNGEVLFVYGDAEATSGWMYGIVTYGSLGKGGEVTVFTPDGEEVDYEFAERADASVVDGLNYYGIYNDAPDANGDLEFAVIKYKLNKDGEIDKNEHTIAQLKYTGDVIPNATTISKSAEKAFVTAVGTGAGRYYINSSTVFMTVVNSDGELDPEVLDYEDIYDIAIAAGEEVYIFGTAGETAKMIVFLDPTFVGTGDDIFYGVVTDKPWKEGDDWVVSIDVFGEGEAEYVLADYTKFVRGDVVSFKINSAKEIVWQASGISDTNGTVYKDGYLTVDAGKYLVDTNAVVYAMKDQPSTSIDGKISRTRVDSYDNLKYIIDDEVIVAIVVQNNAATSGGPGTGGYTFEYGAAGATNAESITVTGLTYEAGKAEYIVRISGDALSVAIYSDPDSLTDATDTDVELVVEDDIPVNGIYKVELINTSDYSTVIAETTMYLPKNN